MTNRKKFNVDIFALFDKGLALLSVKKATGYITMPITGGQLGSQGRSFLATAFARSVPEMQKTIEQRDFFTISFYPAKYGDALKRLAPYYECDSDEIKADILTPATFVLKTTKFVSFEETELTFYCKKIFCSDFAPQNMLSAEMLSLCFGSNATHSMYIGDVLGIYLKMKFGNGGVLPKGRKLSRNTVA